MAIPDFPLTREEGYLHAQATGDTSTIPPTPYTRKEQYLDVIARNGGGGGGSSGGSGALVCHINFQTFAVDHTWQELFDSGLCVLLIPESPDVGAPYNVAFMGNIYVEQQSSGYIYGAEFFTASAAQGGGYEFAKWIVDTDSPGGYPVLDVG